MLPVHRILLTAASTAALSGVIVYAFWHEDWRYSLPTPRPATLVQPPAAPLTLLDELRALALARPGARPLLVHFTNPDCPCSRFNREQACELAHEFGDRVDFVAVRELDPGSAPAAPRFDDELGMRERDESDGRLARALGVYSTPQAVLLDARGTVFFRGNYNSSRYCTRRESAWVRLALESLLAGLPLPLLPESAQVSWGCPLPNDAWEERRP